MTKYLDDALVGYTANGTRVYVSASVAHSDRGAVTTAHEPVASVDRFSMSGLEVGKGCRNAHGAGQMLDILQDVTRPAEPFTLGDVHTLHALWLRWHLNDMQSHCIHQDRAVAWDVVAPCEETGYKAGNAWLVEPLPHDRTGTVEGDPEAILRFIAGRGIATPYRGN